MRQILLSTLFASFLAAPLAAQNVTSTDPASVLDALQGVGHSATLSSDASGDPMIEAEGDNGPYRIWFYGCTANTRCTSVNFSAGFDLPTGASLDVMNEWNASKLVGRAFLDDENDPFVDHYVVLGGGVSLLNFATFVREWDRALGEFRDVIDF